MTDPKPRRARPSAGRRLALWTIVLAIPIVFVLAGAEAVFRLSVVPNAAKTWGKQMAEVDRACDSRATETAEAILRFRASPFYHEKIGFVQPPSWTVSTTNGAGAPWHFFTNAEGARVANAEDQARSVKDAQIHVYGDSYAAGAEVDYEQAWASLLEQRSGRPVANFGLFGGAPDQAVQYLEANLAAGMRPRQVIVQMIPENVMRMAGHYFCLLYPVSGTRVWAKPRYVMRDGRAVWSAHPMADVTRDTVAGFTAKVLPRDFWGQRVMTSHDVLDAPLGALGLAHYLASRDMLEAPRDLLLADPQIRRALTAILDALAADAKAYKFRAYLVLLPQAADDLAAFRAGRREETDFAAFLTRETRTRGIVFINAAQLLAAKTEALGQAYERYSTTPTWGHASADGNRAIADLVGATVLPRR